MTKLSVNINKIALIRNARGGNNPDVVKAALDCEKFGADGITVHPRPDERHIRYADVYDLKKALTSELNIEGNPKEKKFMDMVMAVKPAQVTLVPDAPQQITSNHGWNTQTDGAFLQDIIAQLKEEGIRTSIFVDPNIDMVEGALATQTDRIELYTESFAQHFAVNPSEAIAPYLAAAQKANELGLGLNAGHDLSLENLRFFCTAYSQLVRGFYWTCTGV
jgi:pyridoxine 5-phosphate synthase